VAASSPALHARGAARERMGPAWALLPIAIVLVARLVGPDDLDSNDQAKQCLYVLDVWEEGRWVLPMERGNIPATKPPLFTWLAVGASALFGGPAELPCRLPSVVASLAVAALIYAIGRERWSPAVGVAAACIFATSHTAARLAVHVRPDMVLTALTTAALLALHRLDLGRSRGMALLFWASASLSILAKGPPGPLVILAALACLSFSRERRPWILALLRSPWILLLLAPLAWFVLAMTEGGKEYLLGTVWSQTFERALATGSRSGKGQLPGQIFALFASRFAPWSIVAIAAGLALISRRSAREERARFALLCAWTFGGLAAFALSRGQREDYLLPMIPAASLLVAGALDRPPGPVFSRVWRYGIGAPFFAAAGCVGVLLLSYFALLSPDARAAGDEGIRELAGIANAERRPGDELRMYGAVANGIRFYTRSNRPSSTREELASLLDALPPGKDLLVIADRDSTEQLKPLGPHGLEVIASCPHRKKGLVLLRGRHAETSGAR